MGMVKPPLRLLLGHLNENLVLLDEPQFEACVFLDGIKTTFQIAHFGVKPGITLFQFLIDFALRLELMIGIPDA